MAKDIRNRIFKSRNQFENKHHKQPAKMFLTLKDESDLLKVLPKISEGLAERAFTEGLRSAIPKILGCQVVYGADKFRLS